MLWCYTAPTPSSAPHRSQSARSVLGSCVRREPCPLQLLYSPHTRRLLFTSPFWSRRLCQSKCSLALDITSDISKTMQFKQGVSNKIFFFFLLIKLNLWLKRKLWLCRTEDTGMWGVGIIGILTLIQLSFPNWILRCVLLCFCRANVFVVCLVFSKRLFSFTCVLLNGNISNS